jgi:BirA family biotin operon repressor/biotin-[acetyl-CoA-carboxylase] ligase
MASSLATRLRDHLPTDRFGHALRCADEVDSTNERAAAWAADGAPDGAVVCADHQTDGRGRHGRTWTDTKGQNLLFSVVLRPQMPSGRLGLLPVAASVAVAETVDAFVSPHRAALKWPNDVLLGGRKACGMLLESSLATPQRSTVVVLGVGLNVNQTDFPDALADTATSLRLVLGRPVPRAPLLARLLAALEHRSDAVQQGRAATVRRAYEERLVSLHKPTTLHVPSAGRSLSGTVQGITDTGALRLDTPDGPATVHAGEATRHR